MVHFLWTDLSVHNPSLANGRNFLSLSFGWLVTKVDCMAVFNKYFCWLENFGGDGGHSYPSLSELLDKRRKAFCDTVRLSEVVISESEIAWIDIRIWFKMDSCFF